MPRPRFDRLEPEVQARILDAAEVEFAAHGAEKASINRIIAAAGISKGAIYYYFDDKEDLFLTVVRRASRQMVAGIGGLLDGELPPEGFWAGMRTLIERFWAASLEDPTRFALIQAAATVGFAHGRSPSMDALMLDCMGWTEAILAAGDPVGAVRTDVPRDVLAHLVLGVGQALDLWALAQLVDSAPHPDPAEIDRILDLYVDTFRRLVSP